MSNEVNMNVFLHSLLVIKKMDDFTVTEARDALLKEHEEFDDAVEARKFIYRQLTRNIEKGFLKRTDHLNKGSKKVIYSQTEKLLSSQTTAGTRNKKVTIQTGPVNVAQTPTVGSYEVELKKELTAYEIDLNTTLEEAKEYKRLSARFPELQGELQAYHSQAKVKSIKLLGKLHALQNLLGYTVTDHQSC